MENKRPKRTKPDTLLSDEIKPEKDDSQNVVITGNNNVVNLGGKEKRPPTSGRKSRKKAKKNNPIIMALITLIGTIITALLTSPVIIKFIDSNGALTATPSSTLTPSYYSILTVTETQTVTPTLTDTPTFTPTFTPSLTFTVTNTFTPTPFVKLEDGVPMILIPAGFFNKYDKEKGYIKTSLPNFFIDQHEVTNSQYKQCVDAGVCVVPFEAGRDYKNVEHFNDNNYNDYPVVLISYYMAKTYCEWRDKETRLPSGDEWEKAARGLLADNAYPWGNNPPTCDEGLQNGANYLDCNSNDAFPVERFSPNGYGVYDMAGNVAEWVDEGNRFIRGGSWLDNESHIKGNCSAII